MKKTSVKRLLAAVLAVIMIFAVCPFGTLGANEDETVARVSYFCIVKSPGHCWIYVENLSDETVKVGAYKLAPGDGVSVGTFGPTRYDGKGIYYNVEAYCQTVYGMSGYKTLTENLTEGDLKTLSDGILSYKNKWSAFRNCVTFAAKMWNLVSDKKLSNLIFPAFSDLQLSMKGCNRNAPVQKPVTAEQVYRQRGNGNSAYLENVRAASLGNLV